MKIVIGSYFGDSVGQGWARDGTGQSRDFMSRSHLSRGTTMRDSPAKICPGPARPADFCNGPGPTGHQKRGTDRDSRPAGQSRESRHCFI